METDNDIFWGLDVSDLFTLGIALLALGVSAVGTYQANKRAKEALAASRKAAVGAHWSALQEAVQRLMGFDPTAEPVGERMTNLRIAIINLTDELEGWDGFESWLWAEHALGATLSQELMETAEPNAGVEQRVKRLEPLMAWASALSGNLRRFRSVGHDQETLSLLQANAEDYRKSLYAQYGWQLPPAENPRLRPLS